MNKLPNYAITIGDHRLVDEEPAYDPVEIPQEEEKKELPPTVESK